MTDILHLRCFNHAAREAVARCPQCGQTFCRECITEHEGRVACARCLAALVRSPKKPRIGTLPLLNGIACLVSFFLLWAVFYYLGKALLLLPSDFHDVVFR